MELFISIVFGLFGLSGFTLYTFYSRWRKDLIIEIRNLLEDCRKLKSWGDKSELKLPSWIEGDEREFHKKSLSHLWCIRNNTIKYWQIHREMDDNEPYGTYQTKSPTFKQYLLQRTIGRVFKRKGA